MRLQSHIIITTAEFLQSYATFLGTTGQMTFHLRAKPYDDNHYRPARVVQNRLDLLSIGLLHPFHP